MFIRVVNRPLVAWVLFLLVVPGSVGQGAEKASAPPAVGEYETTRIESVRGGLIYSVDVQLKTHEVYVAATGMRGGIFGPSHGPSAGTWRSANGGKSWQRIGPGGHSVRVSQGDPKVI